MLVLAIVALEVPLAIELGQRVDAEVRSEAKSQADVVAATAAGQLRPAALDQLSRTAATAVRGRVVIVDRQGRLVADSAGPAALGASYAARPEIAAALRGKPSQDTRRSETLNAEILATAAPVVRNGHVTGAVRVTQSVDAVHHAVRRSIVGLALIGLFVLAVGLGAGIVIAAEFARPVKRLDEAARRIAGGDLEVHAPIEGSSEQRSLSATFNEMTARLSRAIRAQQSFVADASHQLRTPLTGLRLRIEEARALGVSDGAAVELRAAEHEVERLAKTIDELLVLSRAGEHDAPGEIVDLGRAVRDAGSRWRTFATEHGTKLAVTVDDRRVTALAARADVDRALDALVENAILYSARDTTVTVSARNRTITVDDEGSGLTEDEQEQVFERFFRGRAGASVVEGTGLGLPIARELARRWGGDASIQNRDGRGARATLEFPDFTNRSPDGR